MIPREDRLDDLDQDLGQWRRILRDMDTAPPYRITNEARFLARRQRVAAHIRELEHERAGLIADQIAQAEGMRA